MNNQKDTQKTSLNSYGQGNVLDVKSLNGRHIYEFANKKTEKLVTALYMVTDCMDTDDALKSKLRQLGVELLSDMYKLSTLPPVDKNLHVSSYLSHIDEVISFIEIAYTIGFISEMNTAILKKEFMILIGELESYQKKDKHFTFTLDQDMFSLPLSDISARQGLAERQNGIKDKSRDYTDKRTTLNGMSFTNSRQLVPSSQQKAVTKNHLSSVSEKKDRIDKILSIVKDNKNLPGGEAGVSIKDISVSFTDCSEKTIQRELNTLVSKGQIKKTGSKRWSRYSINN